MATGMSVNFLLNQLRSYQGSLAGGTVEFWNAQTSAKATIYLDRGLTQIAANPYTLSADGNAELFADVDLIYNIIVRNSSGVIVYDWNDIQLSIPGTGSGGGGGTPPVTGSILYTLKTVTTADVPHVLDATATEQFVSRSGESATFVVNITCPAGATFKGGLTTRKLYADGETMHFIKYGTVFYVVA